jgi:hypothetical protein
LDTTEQLKWARWIVLMLWIAYPKEPEYLTALGRSLASTPTERTVWDKIETSSASVAIHGPHVEEIASVLWRVDNGVIRSLSRDAFENPQNLASDVIFS